ncbi:MAG: N-acetylglucosamine kinase [Bacilli bacterium]|jgi:N-acetylglucosamine kinase-like BadF-type ATPase
MKYILGVDGGNTKTDYFLFNEKGEFVDHLRSGTCSHEGLPDSFEGSYRVLNCDLEKLFTKNKITVKDIKAAVFGLAGVDTPRQKKELEKVVTRLGFEKFIVVNDSFLGIKAGTLKGVGVCSINGTGTSSAGIDAKGNTLQVGGIGAIVGDEAGGRHISRMVIRRVFDYAYRFGEATSLTKIVMDLLECSDKYYLMEKISDVFLTNKVNYNVLTKAAFIEADKGDKVAISILEEIGLALARSAGGCVSNLDFEDEVEVVLAGSVWVKAESKIMQNHFEKMINSLTGKTCICKVLTVPPATGAIIWAFELANNKFPSLEVREKISKRVMEKL